MSAYTWTFSACQRIGSFCRRRFWHRPASTHPSDFDRPHCRRFRHKRPRSGDQSDCRSKRRSDLSIGNILGSNLLNILLILGISACLRTLPVPENTIRYEIPFVLLVSIILLVLGLLFGELGRICGLILWALFLLFLFYSFQSAKKHRAPPTQKPVPRLLLSLTVSGLGLAAILVGSDLTVDGAVYLARALGVSERIIGLTLVAFGTSLPELFTSVTAALKKQNDIAIGNIIGSNLFNILFVLGTTSLIQPIPFHQAFFWDGIFGIAATALLWLWHACAVMNSAARRNSLSWLLCRLSGLSAYMTGSQHSSTGVCVIPVGPI